LSRSGSPRQSTKNALPHLFCPRIPPQVTGFQP
jgi:hypothetical protein